VAGVGWPDQGEVASASVSVVVMGGPFVEGVVRPVRHRCTPR